MRDEVDDLLWCCFFLIPFFSIVDSISLIARWIPPGPPLRTFVGRRHKNVLNTLSSSIQSAFSSAACISEKVR